MKVKLKINFTRVKMKRALYVIVSGTVAGFAFDQYNESRAPCVNRGHRERNGGNSIYGVMSMTALFPPVGIPVLMGFLWMIPGIFLSNGYDQLMYPERWDPTYKSPQILADEKYHNENPISSTGSGIPQFGNFFFYIQKVKLVPKFYNGGALAIG